MLLNVRLGPQEVRIVRGLKRRKINVSALVRRGLMSAGAALLANDPQQETELIEKVIRDIPAPPRKGPRLDDRRAVQAHLRKKLKKR
jgi:hypothetical protein